MTYESPQEPQPGGYSYQFRIHPMILWGALALAVVVALGVGGYYLFMHKSVPDKYANDPVKAKLAARSVCEATTDLTKDYGVIPPAAKLDSKEGTKVEGNDKRMTCTASGFTMRVDVECDDMADSKCLALYSVTNSANESLFQRR